MMIPSMQLLYLSAFLFATGLMVLVTKRNTIMMMIGIELMLNAANLNLVTFNNTTLLDGQIFALFIIIVAVCEAAVGMAIILRMYQHYHTSIPDQISELKEKP